MSRWFRLLRFNRELRRDPELASGETLIRAFAADPQLIEGELVGVDSAGHRHLVIEVIDGTHFDIYSPDTAVLEAVLATVKGSHRLPR